jgi:hypothetical protein
MTLIQMNDRLRRRWRWLGLLILTGCGPRETVIRVAIRDLDGRRAPVAGLPLVLLPYNRDSILALLLARGPARRPETRQLDSLFAIFRTPFIALTRETDRARQLRDSLAALRQRIDAEPRSTRTYRTLYLAYATTVDSLTAVEHRAAEASRLASAAMKRVGPRIDVLRRAMTRWEDSTFRSYDSVIATLTARLGRTRLNLVTGADGRLAKRLPPGPWWVYARAPDPADPNAAWYWNLPLRGDSFDLDPSSAEHRPCYTQRCP